uniref:Uncharacterized protein n=1 Tax=uncultured prokaryote TaxID=198431 RepID=A0A0H5Q3R2_9ZZZZ|nr:hypothetical protein [uncultured prokaryote]
MRPKNLFFGTRGAFFEMQHNIFFEKKIIVLQFKNCVHGSTRFVRVANSSNVGVGWCPHHCDPLLGGGGQIDQFGGI